MEFFLDGVSTTTSTTTDSSPAVGPRELGQDDFLRLLVTQLQNQDPLEPMDNAAFVAELAQFSELEQSAKQVTLLEKGIAAQAESLRFSMLPLVGRQVRVEGNLVELETDPVLLDYSLGANAESVGVTVHDPNGQIVRTFTLGSQPSGTYQIEWDGKDSEGATLPPGTYRFSVLATDGEGEPVDVQTTSTLTITGLRMIAGVPMLLVGEEILDPQSVRDLL